MVAGRYPDVKLPVGGAVQFKWPGSHGVYKIPSSTCPDTFAPGNGLAQLSPVVKSGSYTTPALAAGTYWYACQVRAHHLFSMHIWSVFHCLPAATFAAH